MYGLQQSIQETRDHHFSGIFLYLDMNQALIKEGKTGDNDRCELPLSAYLPLLNFSIQLFSNHIIHVIQTFPVKKKLIRY